MASRLLQLDDVRHIESPDKIAFLFQKLGYNASAQQLAVDDLELSPRSAEAIWKAHLIADQGKGALQVLLFQLQAEEFSSPAIASNRMRAIAQSLGRRPSNFLLLGTKDYNQLMLVNPRKSFDAQMNLKTSIRKLLIDRTNPTNYDRDRLEAIAARDLDPEKLYKAQCEAFDVEKLTKQFYTGYEKLFNSVQKVVQQHNPHPYFEDPSRLHQFTQRLLGRTMFLYFLQKKEFLGGDRNFLTTQYRKLQCTLEPEGTEFYSKLLEPLFFETLNKQRPNLESDWGQIPYLNGGLFDWDYGPGIQDTAGRSTPDQIQLPNSLFDSGSANSILGFFNGYNFTIAENVQGDEDVAVDPEMLGKVFENLLAKEERGQSGTFYTPRGIVHFMCVESLSRYLADSSGMSLDAIKQLIELDPDSPEITFNQLLSKEQARALKQALDTVKICDPAVGSGAFPLGMMQVILAVRQAIARREGMTVQRGSLMMSQWKRNIIANNLYGVDIKPEAIEIAKLRMWLSLVVDVPTIEDLEPLPNLDYKLMCGDSLISTINGEQLIPDPTKNQQLELNITPVQAAIQPLLNLQQQYYSAQYEERKLLRQQIIEAEKNVFRVATADRYQFWNSKRRKLKQDIRYMSGANRTQVKEQQVIIEKLAALEKFVTEVESRKRSLSFFQYHLHFNNVFQEKGGFDIVVGNPPYVSAIEHSKSSAEIREEYKKQYPLLKGAFDLYVIFLLRGEHLLNHLGNYSWIIPNKFLIADYAKETMNYLMKKGLHTSIDVSKFHVFEDAGVYPIILLGSKSSTDTFTQYQITALEDLKSGKFSVKNNKYLRVYKTFKELGIKVSCGTTGFQANQVATYLSETYENGSIPFVVSGCVDKYSVDFQNVRYMKKLYKKAFVKQGSDIAQSKWSFWMNEKIVIAGMTKEIEAYYATDPLALGVGIYALHDYGEFLPKFLLGVLNSKLLSHFLNQKFADKHLAGGYLAINKSTIEQLPLVDATLEQQQSIISLVEKILCAKRADIHADVSNLEHEIDQLIYKIYELTTEEIRLLEATAQHSGYQSK